jgi:hypothetical protein
MRRCSGVSRDRPVLPAPVPQAQVTLSKGPETVPGSICQKRRTYSGLRSALSRFVRVVGNQAGRIEHHEEGA